MQYLIRTLTDSTGTPFTHVTKARENETLTVVEAESKEEAERQANIKKQCPRCKSRNTNHKYYYVENEPVYIAFKCFDCDAMYGEITNKPKGLLSVVPSSFNNGLISRALSKGNKYRKDSE